MAAPHSAISTNYAESLTERINIALERLDALDEATTQAVAAGHRVLNALGDEW